ncbi:hypothetical protein SynROS8604_01049 [Synechococcus sp. ROS8604]|nr:hypothetical protein SynROS8604_01049 [Synechococcus sp. ROS8604]
MNAIFNEILKTLIRPKQELKDSVNINNQMLAFVSSKNNIFRVFVQGQ